jgi:hypothetical protein
VLESFKKARRQDHARLKGHRRRTVAKEIPQMNAHLGSNRRCGSCASRPSS